MIKSKEQATKIMTAHTKRGKNGMPKAVRRWLRRQPTYRPDQSSQHHVEQVLGLPH
jgi:hypothetical protein